MNNESQIMIILPAFTYQVIDLPFSTALRKKESQNGSPTRESCKGSYSTLSRRIERMRTELDMYVFLTLIFRTAIFAQRELFWLSFLLNE